MTTTTNTMAAEEKAPSNAAATTTSSSSASTASLAPGVARKIKRIIYTRGDSLGESLEALGSTWKADEGAYKSGRELKDAISAHNLKLSEDVVGESEELMRALMLLDERVSTLAECCDRIESTVESARASTLPLLNERDRLLSEKMKTVERLELVHKFSSLYQLTSEELAALSGPVSPQFFRALGRVQGVHTNCRLLLRTNHRRAGLELMDKMSSLQESAYENLCRWVQSECNNLVVPSPADGDKDDSGNIELNDMLKQATASLRSRPVLLKYCAEEVANARHNVLFRRFLDALTRTTPARGERGGTKNIESYMSTDPVRYLKETFSWIHKAIHVEYELIFSLFDIQQMGDVAGEASHISLLLDRISEGICRPLRVRLEQLLLSSSLKESVLYQMCCVLEYYASEVSRKIGSNATLAVTFATCRDNALKKLGEEMKHNQDKLLKHTAKSSNANRGSLSPHAAFSDALRHLVQLLDIPLEYTFESKTHLESVLNESVKGMIAYCEATAKHILMSESSEMSVGQIASSSLPNGAHQVYLLNCFSMIRAAGGSHGLMVNNMAYLDSRMKSHLESLAWTVVTGDLAKCHLKEKMERVRTYTSAEREMASSTMSRDPELSVRDLCAILDNIYNYALNWVNKGHAIALYHLIQTQSVQNLAQDSSIKVLLQAYEEVHSALTNPKSGYSRSAISSLQHSPEEMRALYAQFAKALSKA